MTNGQLNVVSVPALMQPATQEPTAPAAMMPDAAQQDGGVFAGLLNEIQSLAKLKTAADSGGAEQPLAWIGEEPFPRDPGAEIQAVDLLALFTVSPQAMSASDPAAPKPEEPGKTGAGPQDNEPSDVAGQMVVAAYMQPGRMPEVNIPTPRPVDMFQNGAGTSEQPAIIAASSAEKRAVRATADPLPEASESSAEKATLKPSVQPAEGLQPSRQPETILFSAPGRESRPAAETGQAAPHSVQAVLAGRTPEAGKPVQLPEEKLQNGTAVTGIPAFNTAPQMEKQTVHASAAAQQHQPVSAQVSLAAGHPAAGAAGGAATPGAIHPAEPDRTSNVNKPAPRPVDVLQNVATGSDQAVHISVSVEKKQAGQTVPGPVQMPVTLSAQAAPVPAQHADPGAPVLDAAAASEIEALIAQPRPITALTAAAAVSNEDRTALKAAEQHGLLQRITPEPQIDRVRGGNGQSVVGDPASSLQATASAGESMPGSETLHGSGSYQGLPDGAADNQMQQQQMNGQLQADQQRGATTSAKVVSAEPIRQDIPEQVMQQVKERLVQHEVKPGNQQITLTLSPDTLGELKMNLNLQGQRLSVEIVTESRAVRDAIVQHTDALKESLARQNITMESFDVTTGGKGAGNQGQNQNAWRELAKQQHQQQSWASPRGYQTAQSDIPSMPPYQRNQGQSMLDIHY